MAISRTLPWQQLPRYRSLRPCDDKLVWNADGGTPSPDGNTIFWDNGTSWSR